MAWTTSHLIPLLYVLAAKRGGSRAIESNRMHAAALAEG